MGLESFDEFDEIDGTDGALGTFGTPGRFDAGGTERRAGGVGSFLATRSGLDLGGSDIRRFRRSHSGGIQSRPHFLSRRSAA